MRARSAAIGAGALALACVVVALWMATRPGERAAPRSATPAAAPAGAPAREPAQRVEPPPVRDTAAAAQAPVRASSAPEARGRAALAVDVTWRGSREPASGIPVALQELDHPHPRLAWRFAATDLEGRARFTALRGGELRVVAHATHEEIVRVEPGREAAHALAIPRGVGVRGRVVDSDGRAANNVDLYLEHEAADPAPDNAFLAGSADSMARFTIADVPGGARLSARSHERAPSHDAVAALAEGEVQVAVGARGATFLAQVLDGSEVAIVDTPVLVVSEVDLWRVLLRTDGEGRVALRGVAPGACTLLVQADGFAPWRDTVSLLADGRNEHILRLAPGATLVGSVRDELGKGVAGARITWSEARGDGLAFSSVARSLGDGSFRLPDLPGGSMTVRVEAGRYESTDATVAVAAGGTARVEFELTAKK